jgi:hypothetical protein
MEYSMAAMIIMTSIVIVFSSIILFLDYQQSKHHRKPAH